MHALHILLVEGLKRLMKSSGMQSFLKQNPLYVTNIIWRGSFKCYVHDNQVNPKGTQKEIMKLTFWQFRDNFSPWLSSDYALEENPPKSGAQLTCTATSI